MSWRISVVHHSGYRYRGEVVSSYNEARITPLTTHRQVTLEAQIRVQPPARTYRYWDYWGSVVDAFDLHVPHTELAVTGTSVVETSPPEGMSDSVGWEVLADEDVRDLFAEMLAPTVRVPLDGELAEVARELADGCSPAMAARKASEWVRSHLTYERGTTAVSTSALEAYHHGRGVCQDFAHLTLALLRCMGIPCRYTSGYLHPSPDAGLREPVAGESHAWVELWTGDWRGFDPTNGAPVGERHVVVGKGRDYADVAPLKGVYRGGPAEALGVAVELTRLA